MFFHSPARVPARTFWSALLCFIMAAQPAAALAAPGGNCFEQAADKINPGSRIDLITAGGDQISGRLEFIDIREKLIRVTPAGGISADDQRVFRLNEVSRLQYRTTNSHPGWMLGGAAIGVMAGLAFFVGADLGTDHGRYGSALALMVPVVIGGLAGLALGAVVPSTIQSSHTIVCEPAIAREGP